LSDREELFSILDGDLITFDTDGVSGVFYLFDNESDLIISKDINTGEEKTILETDGNYVYSVEQGRDRLFITGLSQGSIVACDLDGSNMDTILTTENPVFHRPTGLSYNKKEDRLYFTISFSGEKIQSCKPDGSDVVTLVPDGLEAPDAIVVIGDNLSSVAEQSVPKLILNISPNPSANYIELTSSETIVEISIYSQLGEIIYHQRGESVSNAIDISHLNSGTYHVRVLSSNGIMASHSFAKL